MFIRTVWAIVALGWVLALSALYLVAAGYSQ